DKKRVHSYFHHFGRPPNDSGAQPRAAEYEFWRAETPPSGSPTFGLLCRMLLPQIVCFMDSQHDKQAQQKVGIENYGPNFRNSATHPEPDVRERKPIQKCLAFYRLKVARPKAVLPAAPLLAVCPEIN